MINEEFFNLIQHNIQFDSQLPVKISFLLILYKSPDVHGMSLRVATQQIQYSMAE